MVSVPYPENILHADSPALKIELCHHFPPPPPWTVGQAYTFRQLSFIQLASQNSLETRHGNAPPDQSVPRSAFFWGLVS